MSNPPDEQNKEAAPRQYVVVAALDLHETGDQALSQALELARGRPDAELHIVHVVLHTERTSSDIDYVAWVNDVLRRMPAQLHRYVKEKAMGELPPRTRLHLRLGKVGESIAQFCVDYNADVVVVGTRNRGGLSRMILGSVADTLVHHAHCPVLVARPKDYATDTRSESPEPVCDDCAKVRKESGGEISWCEFHSRPHVHAHVYGYSADAEFGAGHDPGLIPE